MAVEYSMRQENHVRLALFLIAFASAFAQAPSTSILPLSGGGTITPPVTLSLPALNTTPTNALTLLNSTPAAAGAQQYSPAQEWSGNGWVLLTAPGAPTSGAPTSGGSCTAGTHYWLVTFINATGETTMGAASAVQTCVTTSGQTVPLTAIPTGLTGTTGRNVYASKAGAAHSVYTDFFLACASAPCIADNATTTFSFTLADASLGANPPSTNGTGNSQAVNFRAYVVPVQGTTTGSSYLGLFYHPPSGPDVMGISILPTGVVVTSASLFVGPSLAGYVYGSGLAGPTGQIYVNGTGGAEVSVLRVASILPAFGVLIAPIASANYGTVSIGSGAFDGITAGKFVGSANGTQFAINAASGSTSDLAMWQVAGVTQFQVSAAGVMTLGGSTFVLGGHTCSIVSTVLTCP